ncbi:gasdermin Eb isoform X2 [Engraulis encrasicolus]|uniref:gasdermin Eb isoform X2 n=1 Tax=Engraulis encrasicolus TaxID=184585 RepID=UPI002FCEF58F
MFSRATSLLLSEIDPDGSLIAVQRLNDADKLDPLAIVIKRRPSRLWFWKRTKYRPTGFNLNDVLTAGQSVQAEVKEVDFLKYSGRFEDKGAASLEAETGSVFKAGLEGKGSSKLQCNFGALKKKEVDIRSLERDSQHKQLDLDHTLMSQLRRGRRSVCVCVRECVFNTQECVVSEEQEESGSCNSILGATPAKIKVSVKQSGSLESDNDVSLTIPACTTLAYSVIELEVDHTGHYELCLVQELKGGFEVDGPEETPPLTSTHHSIRKELDCVCAELSPLCFEEAGTRAALLRLLCDIINMRQQSDALDTLEMVR